VPDTVLSHGQRAVTTADVARLAQVSAMTVSTVLNNKTNVWL
jgi:hypothetical protein